jgi:hypothetical protein
MRFAKNALTAAGLLFGGLGLFLATVGQLIAGLTFIGLSSTDVAERFTSMMAVLGVASFGILWLLWVKRFGFRRGGSVKQIFEGAPNAFYRVFVVLGAYWLLSFIGLALLGGIDNKGIQEVSGHFYILHAHGERTEISRNEYWRQAAYPLWMSSAWALWTAAGLVALSARGVFRTRGGTPQLPARADG